MSILSNLEKLNSECFVYENYESNWWSLLDLDYATALDDTVILKAIKEYAVGYCKSDKVRLRPKTDSYAVMFEKNGERFWFHIQKWQFDDRV